MKRIIVLFLLTSLCVSLTYAQKRTTSVRGYYRKNGTYVSPHTRGYTAGSGASYSSGSPSSTPIYNSSTEESSSEIIVPSILKLIKINQENKKRASSSIYDRILGQKVTDTKLNFVDSNIVDQQVSDKGNVTSGELVFYVSVLRYNGKTIDVSPISRDMLDTESFAAIVHKFKKDEISAEDALDLVSNYQWEISGKEIIRKFYRHSSKKLPKYLTKTIEAIKVE